MTVDNVVFFLSSDIMAFLAEDRRPSLTSLYEQIYKEEESDNLWASLLKEVAENKHNSLPSKQLLVLGRFFLSSLLSESLTQTILQVTKNQGRQLC